VAYLLCDVHLFNLFPLDKPAIHSHPHLHPTMSKVGARLRLAEKKASKKAADLQSRRSFQCLWLRKRKSLCARKTNSW
jgi:hypothetical protein